jgi:hypothetical protein
MRALALLALTACTPLSFDGDPVLEIGTGEFAFEPVDDEQVVPIVRGPQGGDHVWVGLRVSDVDPRGFRAETIAHYTARDEAAGEPLFFEFNLLPTDDGRHFYAGLPHVVEPADVHGKKIRFVLEVTDRGGRAARDTMVVEPRKPEWDEE